DPAARSAQERAAHFYPRSPRGERLVGAASISSPVIYFYPRSPRGERRTARRTPSSATSISIHAPREGSDGPPRAAPRTAGNFYPRSPRGERPDAAPVCSTDWLFLSTLPARGATAEPTRRIYEAIFL